MRSVLAYTSARILLFAAAAAVLYLIGVRGLLNLALAVLISGVVSYVLLSKQRDAVSSAVTDKVQHRQRRVSAPDDGSAD